MIDKIVTILGQLGADETAFYQFGIFFIILILLKYIVLNKLQFVIEIRENKTTKLEQNAHKKFQKSEQLSDEYYDRVKKIRAINQEDFRKLNLKTLQQQKQTLKEMENSVDMEVKAKREELEKEIEAKKGKIFHNVTDISTKIVDKMAK